MIKLLQLIFSPNKGWTGVFEAERGVIWVLLITALPLVLAGAALEGYGIKTWGWINTASARSLPVAVAVPQELLIRYESIQAGGELIALFVGALMMKMFSDSFHMRAPYRAAFVTVVYTLAPVLLISRGLDGIPTLSTWLCWGLGTLLSLQLLYHGVGLVLRPDQTKGFGLFLSGFFVLSTLTGLLNFVAQAWLRSHMMMHYAS